MKYTGYRSPRESGVPNSVDNYDKFSNIILVRLKELGPCILPGGRGQPQIIIGAKYTRLQTIKGDWPILRTGVVPDYEEWAMRLVSENKDKFNPSVIVFQRSLLYGHGPKKGKYTSTGGDVVYFIGSKEMEYIKIGTARDVYKRLDGIQTSLPFDMEILFTFPGNRESETKAHKAFGEYRKRGEWFRNTGKLNDYIKYMMDKNNEYLEPMEFVTKYPY